MNPRNSLKMNWQNENSLFCGNGLAKSEFQSKKIVEMNSKKLKNYKKHTI